MPLSYYFPYRLIVTIFISWLFCEKKKLILSYLIQDKLPVCACIERCERAGESVVPVCGSVNGTIRTYPSECHLYKESCETGDSKITLVAHEACEKKIEEVLIFIIILTNRASDYSKSK